MWQDVLFTAHCNTLPKTPSFEAFFKFTKYNYKQDFLHRNMFRSKTISHDEQEYVEHGRPTAFFSG